MRDDEVTGVDPSVFRKYFREDGLEEALGSETEEAGAGGRAPGRGRGATTGRRSGTIKCPGEKQQGGGSSGSPQKLRGLCPKLKSEHAQSC